MFNFFHKKNLKTEEIFANAPEGIALFNMALPTVVGQLIVLIYSLADTFFIGKTNNPYMVAGVSLLLPVFNLFLPLANLTGLGGGTLISRFIALKQDEEAKKMSVLSIYVCLLISFTYSAIFLIFMDKILILLGANSDIIEYSKKYAFFVIVLGAIPTALSNTIANLLRCCGYSKEAGFGITMGGVLNIFLDPLFMFVIFSKGNEVVGAGLATLLSNVITLIYFLLMIYKVRNEASISYDIRLGLPKRSNIINLFTLGVPASFNSFCFDIDYIVLDKLMSQYGAYALAGVGIVLKAERLPLNIGIGICQAMLPLIAYNSARKNYKRMNNFIKLSIISGLCVCAVSMFSYQMFTKNIVCFFINEINTMNNAISFLRVRCIATTFMFLSFFYCYNFQALNEGKYSFILATIRWLILDIPLLFILNNIFGSIGLVLAQLVGDFIASTIFLLVFVHYRKVHKMALK